MDRALLEMKKPLEASTLRFPKSGYIGIDVGGTKTRLALFDAKLKAVKDVKPKTTATKTTKDFTGLITNPFNVWRKKSRKLGLDVVNVGVGCAGSFNGDGSIKDSP